MKATKTILEDIQKIKVSPPEIKNYINSLDEKEYANLSTAFIIGRSGWERTYSDTNECNSFIESTEANGIKVTQKMLDDKFLTKEVKKEQVKLTNEFELSDSPKVDGVYNHDWLGMKTNLISEVEKGLKMLDEIS